MTPKVNFAKKNDSNRLTEAFDADNEKDLAGFASNDRL